ncbi:MAG: hypothetical protein ACREQ5_14345 [Candidatus Dormibacteria bacterium]
MRIIIALSLLMLAGCSTLVTQTKYSMPTPPAPLMVPPQALAPLTSPDIKTDLGVMVNNNTKAAENADELAALQKWIVDTAKNITTNGKGK